jgi:septum formation protein
MGPTHPSPASARRSCSFPSCRALQPLLILASASPQRRAILAQVGIPFQVRPANVREDETGDPAAVAEANARRKAAAVAGDLVLGADTDVALDGDILGKPGDAAHARELVARLNGRTHEVVGGIALAEHGAIVAAAVEVTRVTFRRLDDATLDWYVATGEWKGRAGGYAIQGAGAALVAGIEGDYLNVVGLPLARLLDLRPDLLPRG